MSSMLEALQGGGGAPPMGGPPPGPDTMGGMASPPPAPAGGGSATDILTEIKGLIQDYIDTPESDEQETAQATKALVIIQGLLASEEKNMEAAAGTTPAHKAMAKQITSLGADVYGG